MDLRDLTDLYGIARSLQDEARSVGIVGLDEPEVPSVQIIPESIVKDCRTYIQRIVREINGCYEHGLFSGCAVMTRRLLETCMIEAFEKQGMAGQIKGRDGNYKTGNDIKNELLKNPFGNLSRNAKGALRTNDLFNHGHKAAHDRFFIARKQDIDGIKSKARDLVEYLVHQFQ